MKAGVQCYGSDELQEKLETVYGEKIIGLPEKRSLRISEWIITPFYLPHDKTPNFGFLIDLPGDAGRLLYATDFEYLPYTFKSLKINYFLNGVQSSIWPCGQVRSEISAQPEGS